MSFYNGATIRVFQLRPRYSPSPTQCLSTGWAFLSIFSTEYHPVSRPCVDIPLVSFKCLLPQYFNWEEADTCYISPNKKLIISTNMGNPRTRTDLLKSVLNSRGSGWEQAALVGTMALVSHWVQVKEKNLLRVHSCWSPKLFIKKYSHNQMVELFYLEGMFRTLSLEGRISVALSKPLQGHGRGLVWRGLWGKLDYIQVCNIGSRQSEHQRLDIRLRNLAFYIWKDASLWAHWIHFFHMHLRCLGPNPISLFTLRSGRYGRWLLLAFPKLLSNHCSGRRHLLNHSLGSPHSHLEDSNLVAQLAKNLLAKQETCVESVGWEDPLEKGKATHLGILAWRIPWTV